MKNYQFNYKRILSLFLSVVLFIMMYNSFQKLRIILASFDIITKTENQLSDLQKQNQDLQAKLESVKNADYLEFAAYDNFGMVRGDSVSVVMEPAKTFEQRKKDLQQKNDIELQKQQEEVTWLQKLLEYFNFKL